MIKITVFEQAQGVYTRSLTEALSHGGASKAEPENTREYEIVSLSAPELCTETDVFAAAPLTTDFEMPPRVRIRCAAAVLYGPDAARIAGHFDCGRIVTYGTSPRDTVTVSSILDGEAVIAVQREIKPVRGQTAEIQEIPLKHKRSVLPQLFCISSMLAIRGKTE